MILPFPMRTAFAALALVVAAGGAIAVERLPTIKRGTPYGAARSSLQALGWLPSPVPTETRMCDSREETCDAFPEAEACAPNGLGECSMLWRKNGRLLSIQTVGDNDLTVKAVSCRAGC